MIEGRWNLPPLTVRDKTANDLAVELSPHPRPRALAIDVPQGPFGGACPVPAPAAATARRAARPARSEWEPLRELARSEGWPRLSAARRDRATGGR